MNAQQRNRAPAKHFLGGGAEKNIFQISPAFCCPALVTEAMGRVIEKKTGIPMVSITYDGTGGSKNDIVIPYLKYPRDNLIKKRCAFFVS